MEQLEFSYIVEGSVKWNFGEKTGRVSCILKSAILFLGIYPRGEKYTHINVCIYTYKIYLYTYI